LPTGATIAHRRHNCPRAPQLPTGTTTTTRLSPVGQLASINPQLDSSPASTPSWTAHQHQPPVGQLTSTNPQLDSSTASPPVAATAFPVHHTGLTSGSGIFFQFFRYSTEPCHHSLMAWPDPCLSEPSPSCACTRVGVKAYSSHNVGGGVFKLVRV